MWGNEGHRGEEQRKQRSSRGKVRHLKEKETHSVTGELPTGMK